MDHARRLARGAADFPAEAMPFRHGKGTCSDDIK
jgi:hypothetical protein